MSRRVVTENEKIFPLLLRIFIVRMLEIKKHHVLPAVSTWCWWGEESFVGWRWKLFWESEKSDWRGRLDYFKTSPVPPASPHHYMPFGRLSRNFLKNNIGLVIFTSQPDQISLVSRTQLADVARSWNFKSFSMGWDEAMYWKRK